MSDLFSIAARWKTAVAAIALASGAVLLPTDSAFATPITGNVGGVFSNPVVLSGLGVDGATGATQFFDNTLTAVFSGVETSSFSWGTGSSPINHSTLTFTGNSVLSQAADQSFSLGSFTYLNGTSVFSSLVFGVDLTLSVEGAPAVTPLTTHLSIVTTANSGTVAQNADFIGFSAFTNTFNVFESATASADLIGQFVGDPQIELNQIVLSPGQSANGFIGNGRPLPEPTSLALLSIGLAGLRIRKLTHRHRVPTRHSL